MFDRKEYMKKYYISHREKILEINKQWRKENAEYRKKYFKRYYQNNKKHRIAKYNCLKLYRNKEWLKNKYIDEKLSTTQISKLCNSGETVIGNWLRRLDIPIRSCGESLHLVRANHCDLSKKAIEWINGELLGDGYLCKVSSWSALFHYSSQYNEYIQYIERVLKQFGILGKFYKRINKKSGNYDYSFYSKTYSELSPIRKQWYPEGKKIVPKDIELTPLTCRQWHIGDGCLRHPKNGRPSIRLSTDSFSIIDVNFLVKKLNNLGLKAMRQPSSNRIVISVYSTKDFLNYIGKCPVKCYQYKWDYIKEVKKNDAQSCLQKMREGLVWLGFEV